MTVSAINTAADAAVTYIRAGDYASAIVELEAVVILMGSLPDSRHGESELRWKPEQIREMLKDLKQKVNATAAFDSTTITYTRPDVDSDYS